MPSTEKLIRARMPAIAQNGGIFFWVQTKGISKVKEGGVRGMNKKIKGKEVMIGEKSCVN